MSEFPKYDILNNNKLDNLKDYTIFKRTSPQRESLPVRNLYKWHIILLTGGGIGLIGRVEKITINNQAPPYQWIQTSAVVARITDLKVKTANCIYNLFENDCKNNPAAGIEKYFLEGFPVNWECFIPRIPEEVYLELANDKPPENSCFKIEETPKNSKIDSNKYSTLEDRNDSGLDASNDSSLNAENKSSINTKDYSSLNAKTDSSVNPKNDFFFEDQNGSVDAKNESRATLSGLNLLEKGACGNLNQLSVHEEKENDLSSKNDFFSSNNSQVLTEKGNSRDQDNFLRTSSKKMNEVLNVVKDFSIVSESRLLNSQQENLRITDGVDSSIDKQEPCENLNPQIEFDPPFDQKNGLSEIPVENYKEEITFQNKRAKRSSVGLLVNPYPGTTYEMLRKASVGTAMTNIMNNEASESKIREESIAVWETKACEPHKIFNTSRIEDSFLNASINKEVSLRDNSNSERIKNDESAVGFCELQKNSLESCVHSHEKSISDNQKDLDSFEVSKNAGLGQMSDELIKECDERSIGDLGIKTNISGDTSCKNDPNDIDDECVHNVEFFNQSAFIDSSFNKSSNMKTNEESKNITLERPKGIIASLDIDVNLFQPSDDQSSLESSNCSEDLEFLKSIPPPTMKEFDLSSIESRFNKRPSINLNSKRSSSATRDSIETSVGGRPSNVGADLEKSYDSAVITKKTENEPSPVSNEAVIVDKIIPTNTSADTENPSNVSNTPKKHPVRKTKKRSKFFMPKKH